MKIDDFIAKTKAAIKWLTGPDGTLFFWVHRGENFYQMAYVKRGWFNVGHYRDGRAVSWWEWWATLLYLDFL